MKTLFQKIFITFILLNPVCYSEEYLYILNDDCIQELVSNAETHFYGTQIRTIREPRGIVLRIKLKNSELMCLKINKDTEKNLKLIGDFLAKNKNPVIIEVHTKNSSNSCFKKLKNWEVSTIIANRIEEYFLKKAIQRDRINSVGYGEFLPSKNTPYNGGNYENRIDIIILCNISGE